MRRYKHHISVGDEIVTVLDWRAKVLAVLPLSGDLDVEWIDTKGNSYSGPGDKHRIAAFLVKEVIKG